MHNLTNVHISIINLVYVLMICSHSIPTMTKDLVSLLMTMLLSKHPVHQVVLTSALVQLLLALVILVEMVPLLDGDVLVVNISFLNVVQL